MKTTLNLLLVGIMTAFCCSSGNAQQLIYSNNFTIGGAVNISNQPPTVANSVAGGTNNATWTDVLGTNNTGYLLANGIDNTPLGDSFLLPFLPQSNHIYLLTATVTFTNYPGNWIGLGFGQNDTNNVISGDARFSDNQAGGITSPRGSDWMILTENSGNVQYFAGPGAGATLYSANNAFTSGPGTEIITILLNTRSNLWSVAGYVNGVQLGTNYTYTSNPTIRGVGMTQSTLTTDPTAVEWDNLSFSTTLLPFITLQPKTQSVGASSAYTNVVSVTADPNGGTLVYQWYTNGVPLVNGGSIKGANTNVLIINPVSSSNAATNYYVIVSNNYGAATSSVASLTVFLTPTITSAFPVTYTNPMTLFGGTNITGTNYVGSTPTFSVLAAGDPPLLYEWLTNGVAVGGAAQSSFTLTNCQLSGPTNFACIVSNSFGTTTNNWSAVYVPTPLAPYPQAVLAAQPVAFWRLTEASGTLCDDYEGGNNGIYTNINLGIGGYNSNEQSETAAQFAGGGIVPSYAGQIQGVDFALTNGANAEFTVEAWAECASAGSAGGVPVVAKGIIQQNEAFVLGVDTNSTKNYEFYVRSANGTIYTADSVIPAVDFTWHHLVGVCDEANTNVSLYVDGRLAASTYIPAKSGSYEIAMPVSIGAGVKSNSTSYNLQFSGYIDDVAAYKQALSSPSVTAQYVLETQGLGPEFDWLQTPPTSVTVDSGGTLVIPTGLIGSAPLGYVWTDVAAGTNVLAGTTNGDQLNATLNVPNVPTSWNGDELELTVTNAYNTATVYVSLNVASSEPQIVTNVQPQFSAPLGGTSFNSVGVVGSLPLSYQWQFNGTNLTDNGRITGSQSSMLTITDAQLADQGGYQVVITNLYGSAVSGVATFYVANDLPLTFNTNGPGWTGNNVANISSTTITNGLLTLTDGGASQARTVFFDYPLYIGAFQASFTYQDVGVGGADGWAFVVQNDPRGASAEGGDGGRVGVESGGGDTGTSIMPSWEVEFNIYTPVGVGYAMETDGQVGPPWLPTGNPTDLNYAAETNMIASGDPINVTLNYANEVMSMVLTDAVAGASFSTNVYIGDLTEIVGGDTAYVGFTGADGGVTSIQTITNFTFVSLAPVGMQLSGTNALVSWPGAIVGYTLQQNPDLTTTNWVNVANSPVLTNDLNQITVPVGGSNLFYRLILP